MLISELQQVWPVEYYLVRKLESQLGLSLAGFISGFIDLQQAKLSLDIANKICEITKEEIKADVVGMTDKERILAYADYGVDKYCNGQRINNNFTKAAIKSGSKALQEKHG